MTKTSAPIEKLAFTVAEAVAATGISRSALYEDMKAGKLRVRKRGAATIIRQEDLAEYLNALPLADRN